MIYLTHIDLKQNELQNAVVQPLAVAPASPKLGQIYTDSASNKIKWYDGTAWKTIGVVVESSATNGSITVDGVAMEVYELPNASTTTLGGIKVGQGLAIDANGVLSATQGGTADAVEWEGVLNKPSGLVIDDEYVHTDNNLTDTLLTKLNGIAAGAEVNVQSDWNVTSTTSDAFIRNKPTLLSQFTDDLNLINTTELTTTLADYYTKAQTYSQTEVNNLISTIPKFAIQIVTSLPTTEISATTIYLIANGGTDDSVYDEYIYINSKWEKIGTTAIDLSGYAEKAELATVATSGSFNDLTNKPASVKRQTATIAVGSVTGSLNITGQLINYNIKDSVTNETLMCDVKTTNTGTAATITVTINEAYSNAITIEAFVLS